MGSDFSICDKNTQDWNNQIQIQDFVFDGNFQIISQNIKFPPISQDLSDLLVSKKPFMNELNKIKKIKKVNYQGNIYVGEVTTLRLPHGWGKMFYKNGNVMIGQFNMGKPDGNCFYAKPDGTYHQGTLVNGKLNCAHGIYYSNDYSYIGGFKDNAFHGKGKILKAEFVVSGQFLQGKIKQGKLQWRQTHSKCYTYHGKFNQRMEICGEGVLQQPFGTYRGEFKNSKKHGHGVYEFKDGKKYVGNYEDGLKNGYGQLISKYEQLIYKGQWIDDLPATQNQQILLHVGNLKSFVKLQRVDTLRSISTVDA